ncbi:MAG: PQQ-binding-like beta-propeller repeat protein, partial [Candidatus Acidiferrales bacterium]
MTFLRRTALASLALVIWWATGAVVGVSHARPHELKGALTAGRADTARVLDASKIGRNWLLNGENFGSWHFSPLTQINSKNIDHLGLAWWLDLDSPAGLATEPIEVDGTLYVSGAPDRVFAIDAATGRIRWRYIPKIDFSHSLTSSYTSRVNRGVAVWEGKVFIGSGDCRVTALDASTGKVLWRTLICDPVQTGITGSPAVGDGKVFMGYHGSDTGTRGSIVALDARTGKIEWRFWNVPGNPFDGYRSEALAMAAKTWHGEDWWRAGGGVVWDSIIYDPSTGLVIYGTAGPGIGRNPPVRTSGARLFTDCVIALKADTGRLAWYYQTSKLAPPGTESPENFNIVTTNVTIHGEKRHVVMTVPRWGGFVMLDAKRGTLISEK